MLLKPWNVYPGKRNQIPGQSAIPNLDDFAMLRVVSPEKKGKGNLADGRGSCIGDQKRLTGQPVDSLIVIAKKLRVLPEIWAFHVIKDVSLFVEKVLGGHGLLLL